MEKLTSPHRESTTPAPERRPAVAVVAALAGALLLILLTGYLTMQLLMSEMSAFMAFDARAVGVSADWLPYVWRLSLILLALAAVTVYRVVLQGTAARIVALATLAAVAFIATPMATGSHVAEEQTDPLLRRITVRRIFKTSASPTFSSTRRPRRYPGECGSSYYTAPPLVR